MKPFKSVVFFLVAFFFFLSLSPNSNAKEADLKKAKALNQQVISLYGEGQYSKAIPIAKEVLAIREKVLGTEHPDVAISLNNLALLYATLGDYAKAEPLYLRSLAIDEKALGPEHPLVATSLNNLARLYDTLGDYARAKPLYKRSLAINEKALGSEHPNVALSLNNLAALYKTLGDYAKAEPLYLRSLAIREKALGSEHPDVANSLNNLALLYATLGDYAKAEPLYLRSLAIREKVLGPEHPDVANSLNSLALLYDSLGDYAKAEPLFQRSLAIHEKVLGPEHSAVATSLNNLALLYDSLGDYAKAEPLYLRSLAIYEKILGSEHPYLATSLNNLAGLYDTLGDYAKAEPLYLRSLAIREKALGSEHPDVANSLNSLAALYDSIGDYARAEPLYLRSLAIREKVLGPEHPDVAPSLNNLALLYATLGDYAKAEPLFQRAIAIHEKVLSPEHPNVATNLANLASLYVSLGDYAKSEPLYQRALAINEKALGTEHPHVATNLNNLAGLYAALNKFQTAHKYFKRAQAIDEKLIDQVVGFTSESQKMKFLSTRKWDLYAFLSLVNQHLSQSPSARVDALNVWLKRKGVILEAQKQFQEALIYSDDSRAIKTFQELSRTRAQLSKLTFSGPGKEGMDDYKSKIAKLEKQKEILEARLTKLSRAFATRQKIVKADCKKVARALPGKTVLVEFARIARFNFKATGKQKQWLPDRYLAFILHAGKGDSVEIIDLGPADRIDKAVAVFKKKMANMEDVQSRKAIKASMRLCGLVFEPLKKGLGKAKELFISPDGNLNLIPFEVLQQTPKGHFLIEDYTFNYLAAGRDVIGFGQIKDKGTKALIMGDPDFDMEKEQKSSTLRRLALTQTKDDKITKRSSDMRGLNFTRLTATKEEVEKIGALFGNRKADVYTGREALEEVLWRTGTPTILHLATHGFFLNDLDLSALVDERVRGIQVVPLAAKKAGRKVKIENPLLRSGIALAGANNALKFGNTERSDGIVTAEKILSLKLRGTDMVVLSACDTGLGEVKAGEGVYGLRRAFTQAGTRSLVMSMWQVPDQETKELMVEFYKNIRSGKMNRCQALRQAALKQLKTVKTRYGNAN
ncbi:MAG: CHAT domain-containing protein, partial [Deltaproteobacteria bacterium]|nr:CHAT domain-containing protein [Deltaproteobacteria bacterium]